MWGKIRDGFRSVPVAVGLGIMVAVLALHVLSLNEDSRLGRRLAQPLARLDTLIYDWRFQWLTPRRPEGQAPIVIVDIDEQSLQQQGRWPWSRETVAALVQALERRGVQLIGFDVVFSEPELNPADALLASPALSAGLRRELASPTAHREAETAKAHRG